jgi:hypothetical protein
MSSTGLARRQEDLSRVIATHGATSGCSYPWERALSRRAALKLTGGAFATVLALPALARAASKVPSADPRPIPVGFSIPGVGDFHLQFPVEGADVSTVFDLNGFVGATELRGTGTLTIGGRSQQAFFDVDNRFMVGEYIGLDGEHHNGTFGFI